MANPAYAAHQMRYYCETLNIGYSQPNRNNIYNGGEADCSSLVLRCCKDAGIPTGNAYSTRDMRREMVQAGWKVYNGIAATKASNLLPGDVLLAEGHHTCMYLGDGLIGEAAIDERGGIMGSAGGGRAGDQTGRETRVTTLYSFPWTHVLRWPSSTSSVGNPPENTSTAGDSGTLFVYTERNGKKEYSVLRGGFPPLRVDGIIKVSYEHAIGQPKKLAPDFYNRTVCDWYEAYLRMVNDIAAAQAKATKA